MNRMTVVGLVVAAILAGGCKPKDVGPMVGGPPSGKDYWKQLPEGQLALRKLTDPADIPDFTDACKNSGLLHQAINNSLAHLSKPSSRNFFPYGEITHDQVVASLMAFGDLLDSNPAPDQMNRTIREKFDVYISVGCDDHGTVLFTGYYTPIFDASLVRTEKFKYPIYKSPPGLIKKTDGDPVNPYPGRREIEQSQMYAGSELAWFADQFEAYVVQIQGSAKLRLPDGRQIGIAYAANNGHKYQSVGDQMIKDGKLTKEKRSLQAMLDYFKQNPQDVSEYTWRNPRYIFMMEAKGETVGSLNVPVTPRRTIATDKGVQPNVIYPRACLAYVATELPTRVGSDFMIAPFRSFMLDQDTGGAIRAPGRCDIYIGVGPEAGLLAGQTYREGRIYYLFLKPSLMPPQVLSPATAPAGPPKK